MPIYATHNAASAAEVRREADKNNISCRHIFRDLLHLAKNETFRHQILRKLFLKTLYGYKRQGSFQLHAFVLMPEHVHLLLTPAHNVTLERSVQLIKGGCSHNFGFEFGRKKEAWQRGFTDHRIRVLTILLHIVSTFIRIR